MRSVDTNVLLRWLLKDEPVQSARAESLIESGERIRVDDAALIEVVFVLENIVHAPREMIRNALLLLGSVRNLTHDRPLWSELADLYVAHPKLSVVDIHLTLRARDTGAAPLLTFDRKLASQLPATELLT